MLFLCQFGQSEAKVKSQKSEKALKQMWAEPSTKYFYHTAFVQKGRFYPIKDFINVAGMSDSAAQLRSKMIKRKVKFNMSGSGLVIRNQSFRANKTGDYRLNVRTENEWHVFSIRVVERYFKVQTDKVAKVVISQSELGERTAMEFTDPNVINETSCKLTQPKYTVVFPKTSRVSLGFVGYYVSLYTSDRRCLDHLAVVDDKIWRHKTFSKKCLHFLGSWCIMASAVT